MSDILAHLLDISEQIKRQDPLLKRGIQRGWVCVIPPQLVGHVRDLVAPQVKHINPLDSITGRKTYIIEEAPPRIQYMTEEAVDELYPEFRQRAQAARDESERE